MADDTGEKIGKLSTLDKFLDSRFRRDDASVRSVHSNRHRRFSLDDPARQSNQWPTRTPFLIHCTFYSKDFFSLKPFVKNVVGVERKKRDRFSPPFFTIGALESSLVTLEP